MEKSNNQKLKELIDLIRELGESIAEVENPTRPFWISSYSKYRNIIDAITILQVISAGVDRIELLMNISPDKTFSDIAEVLGKSISAVQNDIEKAYKLGLLETHENKYRVSDLGLFILGMLKILDGVLNEIVVKKEIAQKIEKIKEAMSSLENIMKYGLVDEKEKDIENTMKSLQAQLLKLQQKLKEKPKDYLKDRCAEALAKVIGVNILSSYKSVYEIGGNPLEIRAILYIKSDLEELQELFNNACGGPGTIQIISIENAVPKGFKIDKKHTRYNAIDNSLDWDGSWCVPENPVFDPTTEEGKKREIMYTVIPDYLVRAQQLNPAVVVGLFRNGKPVVKIRLSLVDKPMWLTVISKRK